MGHVSHTDIHTKNCIVWTAARHRAECHPYLEKSKLLLAVGFTYNKDGTTKNEKKKKET